MTGEGHACVQENEPMMPTLGILMVHIYYFHVGHVPMNKCTVCGVESSNFWTEAQDFRRLMQDT